MIQGGKWRTGKLHFRTRFYANRIDGGNVFRVGIGGRQRRTAAGATSASIENEIPFINMGNIGRGTKQRGS